MQTAMKALIIAPSDCPEMIIRECLRYGAQTFKVAGYIHNTADIIEQGKEEHGWFHVATLREPGRVEGKKTMGLELAEQLHWTLPDVIGTRQAGAPDYRHMEGISRAFTIRLGHRKLTALYQRSRRRLPADSGCHG
jgi:hypothetical protein